MDEPVPLTYMLGVPVPLVLWIAKLWWMQNNRKNIPNTSTLKNMSLILCCFYLFICLFNWFCSNYTAHYSFVTWAFLFWQERRQTARVPDARGYKARPRGSRARAFSMISPYKTKLSAPLSFGLFFSLPLYRLQAGSECRRRREILRWGGKNGFTASLISIWTLDQGCRGLKNNNNNKSPGARCSD